MSRTPLTVIVLLSMFCYLLTSCDNPPSNNAQNTPVEVEVAFPLKKKIIEWDEYTGRFQAIEEVEIRSRVTGYLDEIKFKDGQMVKKGDVLFVIDPRPYEYALTSAQAQLELAKKQYERASQLKKESFISTEEIDQRLQEMLVADVRVKAAKLYLQQQWQWPTIHSAPAVDKFSPESIAKLKSFLFGEVNQVTFQAVALNKLAEETLTIDSSITGGNLCLAQTSIGTKWQINGDNKIIFLEEIGERGYRVDRMLEHLRQARVFENAAAILFGDFIEGNEPDGSSLIDPVLKRFAQNLKIPVIQVQGIGHGYTNFPIPLGTKAQLHLGEDIRVVCFR